MKVRPSLCSEGGGDTLQSSGMKPRACLRVLICASPPKDLWQTHLSAFQLREKPLLLGGLVSSQPKLPGAAEEKEVQMPLYGGGVRGGLASDYRLTSCSSSELTSYFPIATLTANGESCPPLLRTEGNMAKRLRLTILTVFGNS